MNKLLLALILTLPIFANAAPIATFTKDLKKANVTECCESFLHWQIDTSNPSTSDADYQKQQLRISASAEFDSVMYLIGNNYSSGTIAPSSVLYASNGTVIDGYVQLDGLAFSVMLAPKGFTPEMLLANDTSFIDSFFAENSHLSSQYQVTLESMAMYDELPENTLTLNDRHELANPVAAVPEPGTSALLALGIVGGVAAARRSVRRR